MIDYVDGTPPIIDVDDVVVNLTMVSSTNRWWIASGPSAGLVGCLVRGRWASHLLCFFDLPGPCHPGAWSPLVLVLHGSERCDAHGRTLH